MNGETGWAGDYPLMSFPANVVKEVGCHPPYEDWALARKPAPRPSPGGRGRRTQSSPGLGEGSVLVAVGFVLEGAADADADVFGLFGGELGELGADLLEVKGGDFLVKVLRQGVDLVLILAGRGGP